MTDFRRASWHWFRREGDAAWARAMGWPLREMTREEALLLYPLDNPDNVVTFEVGIRQGLCFDCRSAFSGDPDACTNLRKKLPADRDGYHHSR